MYHEDGRLYSEGTYKSGEKEGFWVSYNKDGTINEKTTGTYINGVKVNK